MRSWRPFRRLAREGCPELTAADAARHGVPWGLLSVENSAV
jgi:hypothetical protein